MPSVMIQLGVLLCLTGWLRVVSLAQCPSYCTCSGKNATCKNLNTVVIQPFPDDIVNITIEDSENITLGPNLFGKNVEHVLVHKCTIDRISSHAFNDMQSVVSIRFVKVFIQKIGSCAFNNIRSAAVIEFREANIKSIESSAFSDLSGLKEIVFPLSTIDEVKSNGFFNIQTQAFSVMDSDIHVLNTAAISQFQNIDVFNFSRVKFTTVNAGAFSKLQSIAKVQLDMCSFGNIQCNAIMELREATPGPLHQTFTFTNSSLVCNCSTLSMLGYALSNPNAISDSVQCLPMRQGEGYKPLNSMTSQKICPGDGNPLDPTCSFSDPAPVTCKGDLMETTSSATTTTKKGETTTTRASITRVTTTMKNKAAFPDPPTCGMLIIFTFLISSVIFMKH